MAVTQACEDVIRECKREQRLPGGSMRIWSSGKTAALSPRSWVNADVEALSLAELAGKAGKTGGPIMGSASLNAQGAGEFSVNLTDVKVDAETGKVDVLFHRDPRCWHRDTSILR